MATQPTKDKIISSSWELLEELPLTEFSMRKLASRLGMTVSSLYYHFSSKEALFAELIDKASLEIIFPANEKTWQDRLFVYGKNIYAVLESYPNLAQLMMDYPPESENYLRLFDKLLMIVDDIKLSDDHKFYTINLFLNFIYTSKIDSDRLVGQPENLFLLSKFLWYNWLLFSINIGELKASPVLALLKVLSLVYSLLFQELKKCLKLINL